MIKRNHYTATNCTVSFKSIASQSSWIGNSLQRKNKTTLKGYFLKDFLLSNLFLIMMVTTFCVFLKDFLLSNLSLIMMVTTFCVFNMTNNFWPCILTWFLINLKFPTKSVVTRPISKTLHGRHFLAIMADFWLRIKKEM